MRLRRAVRRPSRQLAAAGVVAICVLTSLAVSPNLNGLFGAYLAVLMMAIALIDARYFLIPNELTAAAALLALLRAGFSGLDYGGLAIILTALRGLATALPFFILMIVYRRWRGFDGLGLGDVKLAAVAGLWLGWNTVFVAIEVATLCAIAAYFVITRRRSERARQRTVLPFGLFLAPAIWIGWLAEAFGEPLLLTI